MLFALADQLPEYGRITEFEFFHGDCSGQKSWSHKTALQPAFGSGLSSGNFAIWTFYETINYTNENTAASAPTSELSALYVIRVFRSRAISAAAAPAAGGNPGMSSSPRHSG
jgi:hypothetical protein